MKLSVHKDHGGRLNTELYIIVVTLHPLSPEIWFNNYLQEDLLSGSPQNVVFPAL